MEGLESSKKMSYPNEMANHDISINLMEKQLKTFIIVEQQELSMKLFVSKLINLVMDLFVDNFNFFSFNMYFEFEK